MEPTGCCENPTHSWLCSGLAGWQGGLLGDWTQGRSFFLCWSPKARATSRRATTVLVCGLSLVRRRSSKNKDPAIF